MAEKFLNFHTVKRGDGSADEFLDMSLLESFLIMSSFAFSLSFAAELGDYEEETHTAAFVSEFRFVPNQNEQFELDVLEQYKKLK